MRFVLGCVRVSLVLLLCLPAAVRAQTTGSITGTVHDSTGAVIANAQVTVTDATKGITRTSPTNAAGEYLAAGLGQGNYDITVTAEGFKKYEAKGVVLDVAQKSRVDVSLEVGATTAQITVEGTTVAQVETQSSDLTGVVTGKEISQLELNGRNFTQLITLVPGVSNQTGQDEAGVGVGGNVAYSVNGGRTEYNNWEIDGGDNMDNGSNTTLNVYPSLDAISEVKVLTSNYGAQYGRSGSGTVEVETKSGTNRFHGSAYEFVRNDKFNARNYFNNAPDAKPGYKKNDFGYTVGGPVYIPGVFNTKKDKTFFFWSQEWRKEREAASPSTVVVPTAAERGGDFSDPGTCPASGTEFGRDPNATGLPANTPIFTDCPSAGPGSVPGVTFLGFPGNQVPVDSANAVPLLSMIPLPTQAGTRNWNFAPSLPLSWREELFRVDHDVNSKVRVTFRYIHDSWDKIEPAPLWTNGTSFPTVQTNFKGPGVSMVARMTANVTPTLLNEFVASYTTDHITLIPVGAWHRPNPDTLTIPGLYANGFGGGKLPGISLSGGSLFNFGEDVGYLPNGPYNSNPTYTYRDNVIKILGRHNLQFGAYFVAAQKNELGAPGVAPNGALAFDGNNATVSTGNPVADLLMGNVASFSQESSQLKFYNRYKIFEPYFQDDWHVTPRLTLNLGLRVSMFGTYRERYHQEYNFDPAAFIAGASGINPDDTVSGNPFNGIAQCGGPGGAVPGFTGATVSGSKYPGCMKGHLFNPAPRIGFAWDPWGDGKTAIRGGYGVFFEHTNGNEANVESLESATNPNSTTTGINNVIGYSNIVPAPAGATTPFSAISVPSKAVWPYVQQWHLDVQRDISRNTVATISYVGSKGTHLTRFVDLNQIHRTPLSQNPYQVGEAASAGDCGDSTNAAQWDATWLVPLNAQTPSGAPIPYVAGAGGAPGTGPAVNLALATGCGGPNGAALADFFRPFAGVGSISRLEETSSSVYHGLETSIRRSVGGLQLTLSYTFSHSIDDSSSARDSRVIDTYNVRAARASSNFDQRHLFNLGYVYDLPFFKNPGLSKTLLGGWQFSGITTIESGSPFSVVNGLLGDNAGVANAVAAVSFPDLASNPKASIPNAPLGGFGPLLFNPGAFVAPRGLTYGTTPRNYLRNPRRANFDMALFKHFAITERVGFEFRAEGFNVFNHTQWLWLGGDAGSAAANAGSANSTIGVYGGASSQVTYLRPNGAHNPRIVQLGAKFIF